MAVGVIDVPHSASHVPLRLFYPCEEKGNSAPVFVRGLSYFVQGYLHTFALRNTSTIYPFFASLISIVCWLLYPLHVWFPILSLKVPNSSKDAPFKSHGGKIPLVVFSHGLTGTSEEQALMLARWVETGCVVACCHHNDGSSSRVPLADGSSIWYDHGPAKDNYDKNFRPKQIDKRCAELFGTTEFLLLSSEAYCNKYKTLSANNLESILDNIRDAIDPECVIAAGYSYGAATAALTATTHHGIYTSCLLLDGWFYVDMSKSAQVEFDFPG